MKVGVGRLVILLACVLSAFAQQQSDNSSATKTTDKDIDPLALQVLKAATEPIRQSKSYSFRALVSREELGTNGQVITLFHLSDVTVQRPDKLHVSFHGRGKEVEMFYNAGHTVLYTPEAKFYTTVSSPKTIDATLDALEKRDIFIPIRNFLESDPYESLTDDLLTGYVIGKVMLFDQPVHQLAFTEKDVEWQLWVIGGEKPLIRRMQMIDKSQPERPRVVVDFLDWNLNVTPSNGLFTFDKPSDAKEIDLLKESASK